MQYNAEYLFVCGMSVMQFINNSVIRLIQQVKRLSRLHNSREPLEQQNTGFCLCSDDVMAYYSLALCDLSVTQLKG